MVNILPPRALRFLLASFLCVGWASGSGSLLAVLPPAPYGPVPSPRQTAYQADGFNAFIHFTVNTFTGNEVGYGDEPESVFDPTEFDPDQIARVVKDAGMKGIVLTAKHHDGFCLWPSMFTEHSVKNSPWKNGRGDVVREMADACRRHGLKFGVYLSPWDRNRADYGRPGYVAYYRKQLRELLTRYGPISEIWFDGANIGTGYYGGAREKRTIEANTYYGFPEIDRMIRELQPGAIISRDLGPDARWGGNESGTAGDPLWCAVRNEKLVFPTQWASPRNLNGERDGTLWMPPECPVSILDGKWFYKPGNKVRPFADLRRIYFESIGRGANLLLNLPPDRRGRIPDDILAALREFHRWHDATFGHDLAAGARATAGNERGGDARFAAGKSTDGDPGTYWCTDDGVTASELVLEFSQPTPFNVVRLREYLPLGQRVDEFALDSWQEGRWKEFARGSSIGNNRLISVPTITSSRIRLRIVRAAACPAISEFGVFLEPPAPRKQKDGEEVKS